MNSNDKFEAYLKKNRPAAPNPPADELQRIQRKVNDRKKNYFVWAIPALAAMLIVFFFAQTQLNFNTYKLTETDKSAVNEMIEEVWESVYEEDDWSEDLSI